jgi:hypothetical protein
MAASVLNTGEGANVSAKNEGTYRSASRLALWASILFVAHAVTAAVAALLDAYQLALLSVFRFGGTIPRALAETQDARQCVIAVFECGVEFAAIVLLLIWLYRFSRNTWCLGIEGMQYTPGWSVGWFFVPLAGLVMPYNVFNELWKANSPSATGRWRRAAVSPVLGVWWAACVASAVIHYSPLQVVLGRARMTEFRLPEDTIWLDHLWEFFWGRLLVDLVGIAVSVLTVVVVVRLTALQKRRHAAAGEPEPPNSDSSMGVPFPAWRRNAAPDEPENP